MTFGNFPALAGLGHCLHQMEGAAAPEPAMAYFEHSLADTGKTLRDRLARLLETPFDRRQRRLAAQVDRLRALTDAELAARGLRRQDILLHVFSTGRRGKV